MKEIAVVAYHQSDCLSQAGAANEVELIMPQLRAVFDQVGLNNAQDVDFVCSGSYDYLQGAAFAFVAGVDALGAVPPIKESHVEMDAAWALYESMLKIRMGHAESALIYGFAKSSSGELPIVLSQQLDPYYLAPLWVDTISLAAMQARLMLDQGKITERDMAEVVARSRRNALANPRAQLSGNVTADELLAQEMKFGDNSRSSNIRVQLNRLALAVSRPETENGLWMQALVLDEVIEDTLCVIEKLAGLFAILFVAEDFRIDTFQLPCPEERRPVDILRQFLQRIIVEHPGAGKR